MKKLILVLALIAFTVASFAQTDSTYTTFSSTTINGSEGIDTCTHEWFTTVTDNTDTVTHTRVQVTSKQCVKCGKQISVENVWKTYPKQADTDTVSMVIPNTPTYLTQVPNLKEVGGVSGSPFSVPCPGSYII